MRNEMDGCLPLEIPKKDSDKWFFKYSQKILGVNSGRGAIYAALMDYACHTCKIEKVFLPLYLCGTVASYLAARNIKIEEYNLTEDFLPSFPPDFVLKENEMILWPNYFGCMPEARIDEVSNRFGKQLILDNTQAFFSRPRMQSYNVYSCRKFVGVPEGAYLIHGDLKLGQGDLPAPTTHMEMWNAPIYAYQTGSNSAYSSYLANGQIFADEFCSISPLTESILYGLDYQTIQRKRYDNFCTLHKLLGDYNRIAHVDFATDTAYYYPFLVYNKELREYLHEKKVFTSMWWKRAISDCRTTSYEKDMAIYLYPLVIDQRYDESDMQYLASLIIDFLRCSKND